MLFVLHFVGWQSCVMSKAVGTVSLSEPDSVGLPTCGMAEIEMTSGANGALRY